MYKFLTLLIISTLGTFAASETTIERPHVSSEKNTIAEKLDLEFVLATEQTKDNGTHEVNGLYTSLKNSLLFSATKNDEFRMYASHVWETYDEDKTEAYWELGEIMYRRKNILNQKDHFISMETELKNYWVMDTKMKARWGFSGAFIPQVIFKKSFTRKSGAKLRLRRHFYDRNRNSAGTLAKEDRIYLDAYYMFNRRFMTNVQMKYRHKIYTGDHFSHRKFAFEKKNVEITTIHPALLVFLGRKAMLEAYVETVVNDSSDKRTTSNIIKDEQIYGAALYLTAF